jgi:hypothetical protein
MSKNTQPNNRYFSVYDIDSNTLDYLQYVMPGNIYTKSIEEINEFVNKLEEIYSELDQEKEREVA